jgi:hypothetical protein
MRPLAKSFSRFILHRAGHLKQLDHSQNPSHFFFLWGRSLGTIRPLVNPFRVFFFSSGKSPETIRPLASLLSFYHRVGHLKQLDHFFQKKTETKKINQKKRGRVFMLIFLYKTYYAKSKENEFSDAFAL